MLGDLFVEQILWRELPQFASSLGEDEGIEVNSMEKSE